AYCLKTQPATGETYPKSDLFNKAGINEKMQKTIVLKDEIGPANIRVFNPCRKITRNVNNFCLCFNAATLTDSRGIFKCFK
ncbi:hypothetical protein, partial [Klebsiella aerogenes]|uniref:hypothetical protein n=1 Tax=Klebsiella aerogenes TaxID=548 RepID=UPI003D330F3B